MHLGPAKVKPLILRVLFALRASAVPGHDVQRATGTHRNKASSPIVCEVRKQRQKGSVDDEMNGNRHFNKHVARCRGSEIAGNTTMSLVA